MSDREISITPLAFEHLGYTRRLYLDNYYQDLTDADVLKLAVESIDALSDADARKVFKARFT
jgi:hypothetical protein